MHWEFQENWNMSAIVDGTFPEEKNIFIWYLASVWGNKFACKQLKLELHSHYEPDGSLSVQI